MKRVRCVFLSETLLLTTVSLSPPLSVSRFSLSLISINAVSPVVVFLLSLAHLFSLFFYLMSLPFVVSLSFLFLSRACMGEW